MNFQRFILFLCCAVLSSLPIALNGQSTEMHAKAATFAHTRAHELNGFLLFQNQKAVEAALGQPFRKGERTDDKQWFAYHLSGSKNNYLVAYYYVGKDPVYKDQIIELEFTGAGPSGPTGFFGLQLGDSAEKVEAVIDKPTEIRHEDDVNVDLWDYEKNNYSLEFTPDHKLYSIQIVDQSGKDSPGFAGSEEVRLFAEAVQAHDIDKLMELSSGQIECSHPNDVYSLQSGPARGVLLNPKSGISICLQRAAKEILALSPGMKGVEDQIRVYTKAEPGTVTKFPASCPLKEVVFRQEAGAFRVYEVTFR
ncbi:MAG: hypothetical protein WAN35_04025 [Terracidiphilus sp.]